MVFFVVKYFVQLVRIKNIIHLYNSHLPYLNNYRVKTALWVKYEFANTLNGAETIF